MMIRVIIVQVSVIVNNVNILCQVTVGRQSLLGNTVTQNGDIFYHKN